MIALSSIILKAVSQIRGVQKYQVPGVSVDSRLSIFYWALNVRCQMSDING